MSKNTIKIPLDLSHVKIKSVKIQNNGEFHIHVSCDASSTTCHKCGNKITQSHGQCKETIIEHLPILDNKVFIHVCWPRFICRDCNGGPTTSFHPDWLNGTGDMTKQYENYCLKYLINSTIKDVAIKLKTTEEKIQGILNRNIVTSIDWENYCPTAIGIDEIALRKGHNHYLTIVSDISKNKNVSVIAVLDGRTLDDVVPFLETIPRKILLNLISICVDMGASFISSLKKVINDDFVFNKIVTIDRFHVSKLLGDAVDDERKVVTKELKKTYAKDEDVLNVIKDTMWPLRHNPKDLLPEQQEKIDALFELSPHISQCYELKEELYLIFESNYSKEEAKVQIENWANRAGECVRDNTVDSPFSKFIKTYYRFKENILNYFETRATSGPVEGLNNKLKTIKRRGFGFRNVQQFAQRIFLDINYKKILLPNSY